jgi:hypothetical protein
MQAAGATMTRVAIVWFAKVHVACVLLSVEEMGVASPEVDWAVRWICQRSLEGVSARPKTASRRLTGPPARVEFFLRADAVGTELVHVLS